MPRREKDFIGYSSCSCNAGFEPGVVLDPFGGALTTCVVAKKQGKNYIAIELKPEYIEMGQRRLDKIPEVLF
jgi:DNA modification methylase